MTPPIHVGLAQHHKKWAGGAVSHIRVIIKKFKLYKI